MTSGPIIFREMIIQILNSLTNGITIENRGIEYG
jgi:hypothetical protein